MFSGKTEELIRRLRRAELARQRIVVFKPSTDDRFHANDVVSHDSARLSGIAVAHSTAILELAGDAQVVGIDEAQFLDAGLPDACARLADGGVRVIVAGLDMDFRGQPFGPMPQLLARAERITKVHAICMGCGANAVFSHRTTPNDALVVTGADEAYVPLCRACFKRVRRTADTSTQWQKDTP